MKLSLATTLLCIQGVSSSAGSSASSFLRDVALEDVSSNNAGGAGQTQSDAKRRKLQRLQHLQQKHQQLHINDKVPAYSGLLKNEDRIKGRATNGGRRTSSVEESSNEQRLPIACNPEADVGILLAVCGNDDDTSDDAVHHKRRQYRCVASEVSPLGGYCAPQQQLQGGAFAARSRLKNHRSATKAGNAAMMECDPDVGVLLACPTTTMGQHKSFCVRNPQSSLGGFCHSKGDGSSVLDQHRRNTEQEDYGYTLTLESIDNYYCNEGVNGDDTFLQTYHADCDCTGFDRNTGGGVIVCTDNNSVQCFDESPSCPVEGCLSNPYEIRFEAFQYQSFEFCYEINLDGELQRGCISYNSDYSSTGAGRDNCSASFNGESCDCTYENYYINFNCSEAGGGAGSSAIEILPGLSYECLFGGGYDDDYYNGQSHCWLYCEGKDGRYDQAVLLDQVVDVPWNRTATNGTATCSELYRSSIRAPDEYCDSLQSTFKDHCCVPRCSVCPRGYRTNYNSSTNITGLGETSCESLQYEGFDEATCSLIEASAEAAAEDCCSYRCNDVCGRGERYDINWGATETDSVVIPGFGNVSCSEVLPYGRGELHYEVFSTPASCSALRPLMQSSSCCSYRCYDVCGEGYDINWRAAETDFVVIPGFGNVSCSEVLPYWGGELHYEVFSNQEACSALRPVMQSSSCCQPQPYSCSLCEPDSALSYYFGYGSFGTSFEEGGGGVEVPDLGGNFTCLELYFDALFDGAVLEGQCDDVRSITHPVCCTSFDNAMPYGGYDDAASLEPAEDVPPPTVSPRTVPESSVEMDAEAVAGEDLGKKKSKMDSSLAPISKSVKKGGKTRYA